MNYEISDMELCHITEYVELFISVFNSSEKLSILKMT